jgi:hypothetical protein
LEFAEASELEMEVANSSIWNSSSEMSEELGSVSEVSM